jgi:two-component system sensor histidine kinase/response regulator
MKMSNEILNILIIDDNKTFGSIASDILIRNIPEINIRIAESGMEGIRILGNNSIDLILMDVFMPVFDGLEIAKVIRANPKTHRIPIIFITAENNEIIKEKALTIGGIDYLNKSFKADELIRMVSLYLRMIRWERNINHKLDTNIVELNEEIKRRKEMEKSLVAAGELLKNANSAKDKLFSIIAHDLKNPLGSFKNLTEQMIEDLDELSGLELSELLESMKSAASNLYNLLENLLAWTSSQSGNLNVIFTHFNLSKLIDKAVDLSDNSAKNKNIKLVIERNTDGEVYADINMIETILRNLINNSIKFTPNRGTVTIIQSEIEDYQIITVKDNGAGMSDEDKRKILSDEHYLSKPGTNNEKGNGFGLSICKEFLKLHASELNIKSELFSGTEISFKLRKYPDSKNQIGIYDTNN